MKPLEDSNFLCPEVCFIIKAIYNIICDKQPFNQKIVVRWFPLFSIYLTILGNSRLRIMFQNNMSEFCGVVWCSVFLLSCGLETYAIRHCEQDNMPLDIAPKIIHILL